MADRTGRKHIKRISYDFDSIRVSRLYKLRIS